MEKAKIIIMIIVLLVVAHGTRAKADGVTQIYPPPTISPTGKLADKFGDKPFYQVPARGTYIIPPRRTKISDRLKSR